MDRRSFLTFAVGSAGLAAATQAVGAPAAADAFVDTNVHLGSWAVRRGWADTPVDLETRLRRHGVTAAWTGNFDAVLHSDLAGANARLAAACAGSGGLLVPFGTVNPTFPDWAEDLRRCREVHGMPGIRLYPNYHGYGLDDPRFAALVARAAASRLLVQITVLLEDERSQNPALVAAPVNLAPLPEVLAQTPGARVMLLNSGGRVLNAHTPLLQRLIQAGCGFELATLEGAGGLGALLQRSPGAKVAFGSHAPWFYFDAALLKLQESELTAAQLAAVRHGHATALLAPA
jgi:hypothetical protein